jgi:hypothetical protein
MELETLLDRCHGLELRAAGVYRRFGDAPQESPALRALWTELAHEEERHAHALARARGLLRFKGKSRVSIDGWSEALAEAEAALAAAERLPATAPPAARLSAALDIEMGELDAARLTLLEASRVSSPAAEQVSHAERLAAAADRLGDDPHLAVQVGLLRARARLQSA